MSSASFVEDVTVIPVIFGRLGQNQQLCVSNPGYFNTIWMIKHT